MKTILLTLFVCLFLMGQIQAQGIVGNWSLASMQIGTSETQVIDIPVTLNISQDNKIGLGGHLFNELGKKVPVIGVAKSKFADHSKVKPLLRGKSRTPIYVTAIGIDLDEAVNNIEKMHGQFRLPTLLKRADQLCRNIISP